MTDIKNEYIVFGKPDIQQDEIDEVVDTLKSGWLGTGPKVKRFEKEFAAYKSIDTKNVSAVNSCTAALHLSLLAAGITEGDEVITTGLTFCATVNAIIHSKATPVLVDIEPDFYNIDPEKIEEKITPKTKAIIPVHFSGVACDMDKIMTIAKKHDLIVIEDCAHSIEGEYKGKKLGTIGDFGCFSFYVTKNMTTGEGGMVVTKNKEHSSRIKTLALHGMSSDAWKRFSDDGYKHYEVVEPGYKYNMSDIQASIGIHQLRRLDDNLLKRKQVFDFYNKNLHGLPIILSAQPNNEIKHCHHLYTVILNKKTNRERLIKYLHNKGVGIGIHYKSILSHGYYRDSLGKNNSTPTAERISKCILSIPISSSISIKEQKIIIQIFQEFFEMTRSENKSINE